MAQKILIIRFSSFGDIAQTLASAQALRKQWPGCEIHWLVRDDFAAFLKLAEGIDRIISFSRTSSNLLQTAHLIAEQNYSHIYDAHNNLRSQILIWLLRLKPWVWLKIQFARRPKHRLRRALFFKLRLRILPQPFIGALSYLTPLKKWGISPIIPENNFYQLPFRAENKIALLPSAAWPLKRWSTEQFRELIRLMPQEKFVVLGGPDDDFCEELVQADPSRVENLAGQVNLVLSCEVISKCKMVIGSDTGLMHVADGIGIPLVMLVGPSAFGYPFRTTSRVAELDLYCKPCSKDGRNACVNPEYQKCLKSLAPQMVLNQARQLL